MKNMKPIQSLVLFTLILFSTVSKAQKPENWTKEQLMQPSALANEINTKKDLPVIISIGPGETIPNSMAIGMVNNADGHNALKKSLKELPKDKKIVIYCGCCPFEHCPNVRPAIDVLSELKFTNYYLLDLPHNIKIDWIDKGYPVSKK